jgi:hypothetical protein
MEQPKGSVDADERIAGAAGIAAKRWSSGGASARPTTLLTPTTWKKFPRPV